MKRKNMIMVVLIVISYVFLITGCGKNILGSGEQRISIAPSDLQATAVSKNQINLTWKDNSGAEDGYEITWSGGGGNGTKTVAGDQTSYDGFNDLNPGTTYSFKVRAYRGGKLSTPEPKIEEHFIDYSSFSNEAIAITK